MSALKNEIPIPVFAKKKHQSCWSTNFGVTNKTQSFF